MKNKNDQAPPEKGTTRTTSRGRNLYDKIADARERRAEALSGEGAAERGSSTAENRGVVPLARPTDIQDDTDAAPIAAASSAEAETFDDPHRDEPRSRGPLLWVLSTVIAGIAIGLVAWSSGPTTTAPGSGENVTVTAAPDIDPAPDASIEAPVAAEPRQSEPVTESAPPAAIPDAPAALTGPVDAVGEAPVSPSSTEQAPPNRVVFGAMPATPPADPLPGTSPPVFTPDRDLRVMLNAPRTVSDAELSSVVDALAAGGVQPDARRVNLNISTANVRYFHAEDAEAAAALADGIGATLRDFTDFEPSPPEGLIEVWLAGREVGGSGGGSNQSGGALDQIGADLRRLEQGLRRALGGN
ncbi:hypothetical protein GQ651_15870 [Alphaproteobacteria bacterium GH1-50]|uniref:LytR cell envelope-related transcriptional attenuator n=1 Tax=Kangsaoukella pontilimi TaxID=2691042 RepID=A0A7C9IS14_9RHOB|nr:hypothetical protein [Kangsaoukella pontilimi]MXQ09323.1 hypothetical protein [Kangsaoukella pontilimi]